MKTLKKIPVIVKFITNFDDFIADEVENDTLYVSKDSMKMAHNCLCGCGGFICIPLQNIDDNGEIFKENNNGWSLSVKDGKTTVTPSILNRPCEGHYIITNGIANLV